MKDKKKSEEQIQQELIGLHRQIAELEKLESERTQKEKDLKDIENKIHQLFNQTREGMAIIQDRQVKYVNLLIQDLLGYSPEELIGEFFVDYMHPDELPKIAKYYVERLEGKDVPSSYETIAKHKNGSDIHLEIKASIITYLGKPALFAVFKEIERPENK